MTDTERRTSTSRSFNVRLVNSYTWSESDNDHFIPMKVLLSYDMTSPFEVTMKAGEPGNIVSWAFSRDILIDGVRNDSIGGVADVLAWNVDDKFYLRLASPGGVGILQFDLSDVKMFTRWMKLICPQGREEMSMDLVIAQIFREEAR
jgi:hypothetical protein